MVYCFFFAKSSRDYVLFKVRLKNGAFIALAVKYDILTTKRLNLPL